MALLVENPEEYSRVCEAEYSAGDQSALMRMIVFSALSKLPIPNWAADVLTGAHGFAVWDEIGSWDEVFGKPNGKAFAFKPGRRTKRRSVMQREARKYEVWNEILLASQEGRSIDDNLFDEIGRKLGVGGKTEVKRLYAAAQSGPPGIRYAGK